MSDLEEDDEMLEIAKRITMRDEKQKRDGGKVQRLFRRETPTVVRALQLASWFLKQKKREHSI